MACHVIVLRLAYHVIALRLACHVIALRLTRKITTDRLTSVLGVEDGDALRCRNSGMTIDSSLLLFSAMSGLLMRVLLLMSVVHYWFL